MPPPESLPGLPADYTSKFFCGDVVTRFTDGAFRAKVLRCWADEEGDLPPLPPGEQLHPLDRSLLRGEVGITNMRTGELSIVPETGLILFQREILKGDVVKRSLINVESAVVIDTQTEVQLEHSVTKERIKEWVPFEKVKSSLYVEARDRVVFDEWIGTVEEVFEDGLVETNRSTVYGIAEMGSFLDTGRLLSEVLPKGMLASADHNSIPPHANVDTDRIIAIRTIALYITWNAINQQLPISEQEKHPEPKKLWHGSDLAKLTIFDGMHSQPPSLGATVVFRDEADDKAYGVVLTTHAGGTVTLRTLRIVETRTKAKLRWQDGSETTDWASELVPYRNIDDYETWPGEHLIWRGDNDERRPAVVQSFNPHQRIATLLFMDNQEIATVSVLELDVGGAGRSNYGVGIGQQVLICDDNGSPIPEIPSLGQSELPVDRMYWRHEFAKLAERYAENPAEFDGTVPSQSPAGISWWGEVIHLDLDGNVDVRCANGDIGRLSIKRLQLLSELGGMGDEFMGDDAGEMMADYMDIGDAFGMGSEEGWETTSEHEYDLGQRLDQEGEGEGALARYEEEMTMEMDDEDEDIMDIEQIDPMLSAPLSPLPGIQPLPEVEAGPSEPRINGLSKSDGKSLEDDEEWERFKMLEEAPLDHHFIGQAIGSGAKAYKSRLAREHRSLMNALPENILVRAYENRLDLMRCLIIGPEGTPYADAPFVFDIYLNPDKFPNEPPTVHFHSHTHGKGRCNPNLYEEGKVCLSILGTWSGDQSESWSPSKSTLLQVFVSISGLVLVRSPYHCEPAFAKLEGTKEGKINSRLYSEKAYVLSRAFVRQALEHPPPGLEKAIRYLYIQKGRLKAVIDHARSLMEKGQAEGSDGSGGLMVEENAEMWNADAMGSLTMGAILSLRRTIEALEAISEKEEGT